MGRIALVSDPVIEPFVFVANCLASDVVGDCVYISADAIATVIQVTKVDATDVLKMPVRGIIVSKFSSTVCSVVYYGAVSLTGIVPPLSTGKRYFAGASSKPTAVPPTRPTFIQVVGIALDSSRLLFDPSPNLIKLT